MYEWIDPWEAMEASRSALIEVRTIQMRAPQYLPGLDPTIKPRTQKAIRRGLQATDAIKESAFG